MWIESHQELRDHPKTRRAARLLGISTVQMVGHLHFLWWRCLDYAQDGNLSGFDSADIADWAGWEDDAGEFVRALVSCGVAGKAGFIEMNEAEEPVLHDWDDYAGKLIDDRKRRAAHARNVRATKDRRKADDDGTSGSGDPHVTVTLPPTVPNQPDQPNQPTEPTGEQRAASADAPPQAEPPPQKAKKREYSSPKAAKLARLAEAFSALGIKFPWLTPPEAKAALMLMEAGCAPETLAECWRDFKQKMYRPGDGFADGQLSFQFLSLYNRVGNWQDWVEAGRPTQTRETPRNGNPRKDERGAAVPRSQEFIDYANP